MGLDWMLDSEKPKDGCMAEYVRLKRKLDALNDDEKLSETEHKAIRKDLLVALEQVSVSAYEVIGAPRVGIDSEATEWFRKNIYDPSRNQVVAEKQKATPDRAFIEHWDKPFAEVLQGQTGKTGKWVAELAKKPEGLASISGMMCSSLDFRGKAVAMSTVIPEHLRNEAFDDHDAEACADYADRLEASLHGYQTAHPEWQTLNQKDEYGGSVAVKDDVADVEAAIRWLRFWGGNGFGYSGWY